MSNPYPDYKSNTITVPAPCPTCEALARTVMLDQTSHDTQRTWVGLTDEERMESFNSAEWNDLMQYAEVIEAKLREKNT